MNSTRASPLTRDDVLCFFLLILLSLLFFLQLLHEFEDMLLLCLALARRRREELLKLVPLNALLSLQVRNPPQIGASQLNRRALRLDDCN